MVKTSVFGLILIFVNVIWKESRALYVEPRELTKVFGRIADKTLLLDIPGAGTPEMMNCCHGGCDNCAYSHVFDEMSSGRPKWIPLYISRTLIDGRNHVAPWASIFQDKSKISKQDFLKGIISLPYKNSLGPMDSVPADEMPMEEAVDKIWLKIVRQVEAENKSDPITECLTAEQVRLLIIASNIFEIKIELNNFQMTCALKKLTGEEHGATWTHWLSAFSNSC